MHMVWPVPMSGFMGFVGIALAHLAGYGHFLAVLIDDASTLRDPRQALGTSPAYGDNPRVRDVGEGVALCARRKGGAKFRVQVKLGPVVIPDGIYTIVVMRRVRD